MNGSGVKKSPKKAAPKKQRKVQMEQVQEDELKARRKLQRALEEENIQREKIRILRKMIAEVEEYIAQPALSSSPFEKDIARKKLMQLRNGLQKEEKRLSRLSGTVMKHQVSVNRYQAAKTGGKSSAQLKIIPPSLFR
jgi:hypothetical protein